MPRLRCAPFPSFEFHGDVLIVAAEVTESDEDLGQEAANLENVHSLPAPRELGCGGVEGTGLQRGQGLAGLRLVADQREFLDRPEPSGFCLPPRL